MGANVGHARVKFNDRSERSSFSRNLQADLPTLWPIWIQMSESEYWLKQIQVTNSMVTLTRG